MMLSKKIADTITDELSLSKEQRDVIEYGAFALLQTLLSIFAVAFFGFLFGVFYESLIVSFSISILRKSSGGAHASKPSICLIIGTFFSVAIALFMKYIVSKISFTYLLVFALFVYLFSFFVIYKKVPVDSKAKPINSPEKKKKMRKQSYIITSVYMLISLIFLFIKSFINYFPVEKFLLCICGGLVYQVFSLTILGQKTFGFLDKILSKILFKKGC